MQKTLLLLLLLATNALVLGQKLDVGNSIGIDAPVRQFSENFDLGLAFNLNLEYQWKSIHATGEVGWIRWLANPAFESNTPPDAWALLSGVRWHSKSILFLGVKGGYYFNYPGGFVVVPEIGGRYQRYELSTGYSLLNNSEFVRIRITYYWGD